MGKSLNHRHNLFKRWTVIQPLDFQYLDISLCKNRRLENGQTKEVKAMKLKLDDLDTSKIPWNIVGKEKVKVKR